MISSELQGKLGNMMFEIAAIEYMGHKSGFGSVYPNVDADIRALSKPQACSSEPNGERYFTIFKNFDWHKNHDKEIKIYSTVNVPFEYVPIKVIDFTRYVGYFQSELYFPDRDFILNLFEPADWIIEKLKAYTDIIGVNKAAIHVRRGDYIKLNKTYNVLDMDYYNKAMEILKPRGVIEYLIFSNDTDWCKQNFVGDQFTFIHDDSLVELFLMGKCTHQIIANSAFSFWGAYLNNNPYRQIIAPAKWFTNPRMKSKDIIPQSWLKI
jgi:hypothetical protein